MTESAGDGFVQYLIETRDEFEPSDADIRDHWAGEGTLTFHVLSYDKNSKYLPYEIEWEDYDGCVGGLEETLGIEYSINEGILDVGPLKIGMTYFVEGITAHFTRGDGWTTDDDVEYNIKSVKQSITLHRWIYAWWWHLVGWRIRQWKKSGTS